MKKTLLLFLLIAFASTLFAQAKKHLIGYWYKPKTMVNIRFYRNNTFEYSDYNAVTNKPENHTGTYKLKHPVLTLQFDDKTQQTLSFDKVKTGKKNYYLKKDEDYFIKGERVNNAVPTDPSQTKTSQ